MSSKRIEQSPRAPVVLLWQKPPEGFFKLNWDASLDVKRQQMGMEIVVRDHEGGVVASYCATKEFITDPTTAKALAAWRAVELSHHLGLLKIVLEGDYLEVVNGFKQESN